MISTRNHTLLIESKQSSYIYIQLKAEGTKTLFRVGNEERIFTNILSDKTGCIAALDRIPIGLKLYMQAIDHRRKKSSKKI